MGIGAFVHVAHSGFHDDVIETGVREFGDGWFFLNFFQISKEITSPGTRLVKVAIFLDKVFKVSSMVHF